LAYGYVTYEDFPCDSPCCAPGGPGHTYEPRRPAGALARWRAYNVCTVCDNRVGEKSVRALVEEIILYWVMCPFVVLVILYMIVGVVLGWPGLR
jgi:hypothetical protein